MSDRIALMNQGRIEQLAAPLELYDRPRSSFAAGFLGTSNLLVGRVRRGDAGMIFVAGDLQIPIPAASGEAEQEMTLMLRPEHLEIHKSAIPNSLAGTVNFATQFGHSTQYEVQLDAGPVFLVSVTRGRDVMPVAAGGRVFLSPTGTDAYQVIPN